MKHYDTFIFDSYAFDPKTLTIELRYSLDTSTGLSTGDEVKFVEKIVLSKSYLLPPTPYPLEQALFALHLIGGISYYKTCCPKNIEVRSGKLTEEQAKFWNTVYENGLGQFFFENQIDFRGLIQFPRHETRDTRHEKKARSSKLATRNYLVPVGGGKDSAVTVELLRKAGADITLFRVGKHPFIEAFAKTAGLPLLTVDRHLAPELFALNAEGALNGHVPITGYLSFLAIVVALLEGFDGVVWSNERSASYGNVEYLGKEINHQWSKSIAFERMFGEYVHDHITKDVSSFSLLRPFSELRIAELFSYFPQYFSVTTSCNTNWKILSTSDKRQATSDQKWCGSCPKCAFVFAILAPFIEKKTLEGMFGGNLFVDASLLPLYTQLLGLEGMKPFECVGTPEETTVAFLLAYGRGEFDDTPAIQMFLNAVMPTIVDPQTLVRNALRPSNEECYPTEFRELLSGPAGKYARSGDLSGAKDDRS